MKNEIEMILEMSKSGKLTTEQAAELIAALKEKSSSASRGEQNDEPNDDDFQAPPDFESPFEGRRGRHAHREGRRHEGGRHHHRGGPFGHGRHRGPGHGFGRHGRGGFGGDFF